MAQFRMAWLRKPGGEEWERMPAAQSPYKKNKEGDKIYDQPTQWFWYKATAGVNKMVEAQHIAKLMFDSLKETIANEDYQSFVGDTMRSKKWHKLWDALGDPRHGTSYWDAVAKAEFVWEEGRDHRQIVVVDDAQVMSDYFVYADPSNENYNNRYEPPEQNQQTENPAPPEETI